MNQYRPVGQSSRPDQRSAARPTNLVLRPGHHFLHVGRGVHTESMSASA